MVVKLLMQSENHINDDMLASNSFDGSSKRLRISSFFHFRAYLIEYFSLQIFLRIPNFIFDIYYTPAP